MKYAIVALLLFSQIACTTDTNSYTLSGTRDGLEDGSKVIIYSLKDNRTNVIDTLLIKIARLEETEATLRYQLGQSRRLESATSGQLAGQIANNASCSASTATSHRAGRPLANGALVPRIVHELDVLDGRAQGDAVAARRRLPG